MLQDRADRPVIRRGDTVLHPLQPWTAATVALLRHLEAIGFEAAPRVVSVDEETEVLTYLPGDSGGDAWAKVIDERGLVAMARLLRSYHDAIAGWRPAEAPVWFDGSAGSGSPGELVLHGDFGPWNLVWDGLRPTGILDWEHARVGRAREDVAYALQWVAPFCDDATAAEWMHHPTPPDRRRRIALFADAYGLPSPAGLVEDVIAGQRAMIERIERLAAAGHARQQAEVDDGQQSAMRRLRWSEANRVAHEQLTSG